MQNGEKNMFKLKTKAGANNITGNRLAEIRRSNDISQRELARMMQVIGYDVDHHFIRRIENGERFVTDIELVALAKVLEVSVLDLIDPDIPINTSKNNSE